MSEHPVPRGIQTAGDVLLMIDAMFAGDADRWTDRGAP
jgi:hypothetical protein